MYPHGDEILSGVDSKAIPDKPDSYKGPTCGYPVRAKVDGAEITKPCGSPKVDWNVTGRGIWDEKERTPICSKHLEKVWKEWDVDSAERIDRK